MIRPKYDELKPAAWTAEEAHHHLQGTFDRAAREWPDVMERYVVMLAEATDDAERTQIMREGLRRTVHDRYGVSP